MIVGNKYGRYLSISGGKVLDSVLMVQDIDNLVPLLVHKGGMYNVFNYSHSTFRELEEVKWRVIGKRLPMLILYSVAKFLALVGDHLGIKAPINSLHLNKITQ